MGTVLRISAFQPTAEQEEQLLTLYKWYPEKVRIETRRIQFTKDHVGDITKVIDEIGDVIAIEFDQYLPYRPHQDISKEVFSFERGIQELQVVHQRRNGLAVLQQDLLLMRTRPVFVKYVPVERMYFV